MTLLRNTAKGRRGVLLRNGSCITIAPGMIEAIDGSQIKSISAGIVEVDAAELIDEFEGEPDLDPAPELGEHYDEGTGEPMQAIPALADGSLSQIDDTPPRVPSSLTGRSKAALTDIAIAEGILIEQIKGTGPNGSLTARDLKEAIEAGRA